MNIRNRFSLTVAGLSAAVLLTVFGLPTLAMAGAGPNTAARRVPTQASAPHKTQTVPPALRPALYKALAKDAGPAYAIKKDGCATVTKQALEACFDEQGAHFKSAQHLSLHLAAFGRGTKLAPVTAVQPVIEGNQVSYRHGNLTAWWRVLPMGFEQGFTIAKRPAGHGNLTLALAASRQDAGAPTTRRPDASTTRHSREDGNPARTSPSIPLRSEGGKEIAWGKLRYGKLVVTDANGKVVPATLTSQGHRILIAVNDARATYPLTVDPLVWLEQRILPADGSGIGKFGLAVAINGTTALVGAPASIFNGDYGRGLAYVFTESNGTWTQAQVLAAPDGTVENAFGTAVALSGSTAFIGAPVHINEFQNYSNTGAVYIFTKAGGGWSLTQEIIPTPEGVGEYGTAIAVDGTTLLVGAPRGDTGSPGRAFVLTESEGQWIPQAELLASDGGDSPNGNYFGGSVALDGSTAVIGAPDTDIGGIDNEGAAYVFAGAGPSWSQLRKLVASDGPGAAPDHFGQSVAVSGTTTLVGAPDAGTGDIGEAYVFTKSGGNWPQTQILAVDESPAPGRNLMINFGMSVALDGQTALIGAPTDAIPNGNDWAATGAAYLFKESGESWTQTGRFIIPPSDFAHYGVNNFGDAVAVSGPTALIGAPLEEGPHFVTGAAHFESLRDLDLAVSAPQTVAPNSTYSAQTILTNSSGTDTPPISVTINVPAAASFISATTVQGKCSKNFDSNVVVCNFDPILGNAGTAKASLTLRATGEKGDVLHNNASIINATPALSASAPTAIGNPPPLDLTLEISAPPHVKVGSTYGGTITVTNAASAASPAEVVTFTLPPAAASVTSTGIRHNGFSRECTQDSPGTWSCSLNPIDANNTYATIGVDAKVTGQAGDAINFGASVVGASPPITASATTAIVANSPPVAQDSKFATPENTAYNGILVANDADGDPLSFSIVGQPSHGSVKIAQNPNNAFTYTPDTGYVGTDSFTFKANDGTADSNVATVSMTVGSKNSPPVVADSSLTTNENTPVSGTFDASDPDGDPLTFSVTVVPKDGHVTLDGNSGKFTYTPNKNFSGVDQFQFAASDGKAESQAYVQITVKKSGHAGAGATGPWGLGGLLLVLGLAALIRRRR